MFEINGMSSVPVYEQLIDQVERFILSGILKPQDQIPSVRALSVNLSINPNTVQKAFADLTVRKIICGVPGKGIFITDDALKIVREKSKLKIVDFEKIVSELVLAGISKDRLISVIEKKYGKKREVLYD